VYLFWAILVRDFLFFQFCGRTFYFRSPPVFSALSFPARSDSRDAIATLDQFTGLFFRVQRPVSRFLGRFACAAGLWPESHFLLGSFSRCRKGARTRLIFFLFLLRSVFPGSAETSPVSSRAGGLRFRAPPERACPLSSPACEHSAGRVFPD
jgi:hypothetical protein